MFLNILHLKKGDIIFTGTPEGVAKVVKPNDVLEGFIEDKSMFKIQVK
jgi:2-keto-4-pentenoate hydratase/2-oxohepta-3-ene-1,7-dioic acid hydratase in catechol pathway